MTFFITDNTNINDLKAGVAILISVSRAYVTFSILLLFVKSTSLGYSSPTILFNSSKYTDLWLSVCS